MLANVVQIELDEVFAILGSALLVHGRYSFETAPKDWADSYISAFSLVSGLRLVTFDQTLHRRTSGSILLKP